MSALKKFTSYGWASQEAFALLSFICQHPKHIRETLMSVCGRVKYSILAAVFKLWTEMLIPFTPSKLKITHRLELLPLGDKNKLERCKHVSCSKNQHYRYKLFYTSAHLNVGLINVNMKALFFPFILLIHGFPPTFIFVFFTYHDNETERPVR